MPPLELRDAYSELDRQLWKIERERCLEALAAGRSARPYLERRLARIDRMLRALHVLVPPTGEAFNEGERRG